MNTVLDKFFRIWCKNVILTIVEYTKTNNALLQIPIKMSFVKNLKYLSITDAIKESQFDREIRHIKKHKIFKVDQDFDFDSYIIFAIDNEGKTEVLYHSKNVIDSFDANEINDIEWNMDDIIPGIYIGTWTFDTFTNRCPDGEDDYLTSIDDDINLIYELDSDDKY